MAEVNQRVLYKHYLKTGQVHNAKLLLLKYPHFADEQTLDEAVEKVVKKKKSKKSE